MSLDALNHKLVRDLDSRQRDLLSLSSQQDWLSRYLEKNESIRTIHRWNFLQPFTDISFSIEPLDSIFSRYLNYLHYCRFHNPTPIIHLDSDLIWILWNCQNNFVKFPQLSRSSLQLFCRQPETNIRIRFFENDDSKLHLGGITYNLQREKSEQIDMIKLSNQKQTLWIPLTRNLQVYRNGLRTKL